MLKDELLIITNETKAKQLDCATAATKEIIDHLVKELQEKAKLGYTSYLFSLSHISPDLVDMPNLTLLYHSVGAPLTVFDTMLHDIITHFTNEGLSVKQVDNNMASERSYYIVIELRWDN